MYGEVGREMQAGQDAVQCGAMHYSPGCAVQVAGETQYAEGDTSEELQDGVHLGLVL